jgi:hypothetical protein
MMLHVMLAGQGGGSPKGLCGAAVKSLYVSKVPGEGRRRPTLCPVCKAFALKNAPAVGYEATSSGGAPHS